LIASSISLRGNECPVCSGKVAMMPLFLLTTIIPPLINPSPTRLPEIFLLFYLSFACAFAPAGRVSSSSLKMAFAKGLPGADGPELKNFDPLKFSESDNLMYFREAELKHGRIAMLATAGIYYYYYYYYSHHYYY